jgi:hypothetical protein
MKSFKILLLLQTFDKEEIKLLEQFLQSPVVNPHKDVWKLYRLLKPILQKNEVEIDKQDLCRRLFPGEAIDLDKLYHVSSYLLKITEQFLYWQEQNRRWFSNGLLLAQAYEKKGLTQAASTRLDKLRLQQEKQPLRHSGYYFDEYRLQQEVFSRSRKEGRTRPFNFDEMSAALDTAYLGEKLKNACIMLSHQALVNTQYSLGLLGVILSHAELELLLEVPAVAVYYHAYQALAFPEADEHFLKVKQLLGEHSTRFPSTELRDIYLLAINFCIRRINNGQSAYVAEVFELYQTGLENGAFLEDGLLSRWTYNNIVIAGLKLKQYDWIYRFIHQYKDMLPHNHREGSLNFNLAKYYFETGDYAQAMPLLRQMEYDDVLHNLGAKVLLAKMYFELEEWVALDNLLSSTVIYIRRKKVLGYHRENYLHIAQLMEKMTKINWFDAREAGQFRQKVLDTPVLTERQWFLEQIGKRG